MMSAHCWKNNLGMHPGSLGATIQRMHERAQATGILPAKLAARAARAAWQDGRDDMAERELERARRMLRNAGLEII